MVIMRKDQSGTTDTHPVTGRADRIDATVSTKSKTTILECSRFRPELKAVGGLAGGILLLLLTLSSVSAYQMSALVSGIIIVLFLVILAFFIVVAVRCRHRPDPLSE
jgi:hypothetical protein